MPRSRATTDTRIRRRSLLVDGLLTVLFLLIVPPVASLVPVVGGLPLGYLVAGGLAGYFIGRVGVVVPVLALTTTVHVLLAVVLTGVAAEGGVAPGNGELVVVLWVVSLLAGLVGAFVGARMGPDW